MATTRATARTVDLSNVKEGGNFSKPRVTAGDYLAIISQVEDAVAKDGVNQYLFTLKLKSRSSATYPYYCKLQENQLWKLRNIFIAAGKVVPKRKVKVDPNQIVGKLVGVTLEDAEWDGKEQSEIVGIFPAAEIGDESAVSGSVDDDDEDVPEDDEDIEEVADEEEEEEVEEEDPYAGLDRTALKQRIKALQGDFIAKKSQTDDDLRDILRGLEASADEDDEEEEEPAPKPVVKRKPKPKTEELTDDDLDELNIDDL